MNNSGFSLIELIVVAVIISLLVGLLMPVILGLRGSARKTECMSNLRQIGTVLTAYTNEFNVFPEVTNMPSLGLNTLPSIASVFPDLGREVFRCPGDTAGYWEKETASYEWNIRLNGRPRADFYDREINTPVLWGYEAFHGDPEDENSRNILYLNAESTGL